MVSRGINWEEPVPDIQKWLLETNYSLYQQIGRLFLVGNNSTVLNQKLRTKKYAMLVKLVDNQYVMNGEYLDDSGRAHMKVIPQCIANFYTVFAFQRDSPMVEVFDRQMLKFLEYGIVEHWQRIYSAEGQVRYMKNFFKNLNAEVRQEIDFSKIRGAFCFLIYGYATATAAFILEMIVRNNKYFRKMF